LSLHTFLISALHEGEWPLACSGHIYAPVTNVEKARQAMEPLRIKRGKFTMCLPGTEFQPSILSSHFTDWAARVCFN